MLECLTELAPNGLTHCVFNSGSGGRTGGRHSRFFRIAFDQRPALQPAQGLEWAGHNLLALSQPAQYLYIGGACNTCCNGNELRAQFAALVLVQEVHTLNGSALCGG